MIEKLKGKRGPDKAPRKSGPRAPGAGRKSREELGLPAVKNTTVQVEPEVIDKCREKYGSIANALRWAARQTDGAI